MSGGTRIAELLNGLEASAARRDLLRCCASYRWVEAMVRARPFLDDEAVYATAERVWSALDAPDWLEAFSAHPRIGEDRERLRARFAEPAWSSREQSGVEGASEATLSALAAGNRDYAARFGHVFLVCATGKSATEMLTSLRARLTNDPATELRVAAAEQLKITRLRLAKLADERAQAALGTSE